MKRIRYLTVRSIGMLSLMLSVFSVALAQGVDTEPNNICPQAQVMGPLSLPYNVVGSLDTPPSVPDIDFFSFTGSPGTRVRVDYEGQSTGKGTLPDPYLGLFNSQCGLLNQNDYGKVGLNAGLEFVVPADGIFILAATSCCDGLFTGQGGSSGSYQITLALPPPAIGSISGRLIDEVTGAPLRGDSYPRASVSLLRCSDGNCSEFVNIQTTDSNGQFRFDRNILGDSLHVGSYQIVAIAIDYEPRQTDPFAVGEGENRDLGDIALLPPPVRFYEIQSCGNLPPEGGVCRYSVRVTNSSSSTLRGAAWSLISSYEIGSPLNITRFQVTQQPRRLEITPGKSQVVRFMFQVPNTVSDGASICTEIFVGQDPNPYFGTVRQRDLFCMSKGIEGFMTLTDDETQRLLQRSSGKGPWPHPWRNP